VVLGLRLAWATLLQMLLYGALLFLPAGTLRWGRAWLLLVGLLLGSIASIARLWPEHKAILEERLRSPIQKDQPIQDKLLAVVLVVSLLGAIVLIPLDLFHLHFFPRAAPVVSAFGLVLVACGFYIALLALENNPFAAAAIRVQTERGHAVASSGPYAAVRHPLYSGAILFVFGVPLWLGSYAGALAALVPTAAIVARIFLEERFLRRNLPGYEAYAQKVRYRLVPRVF
jgi:protein-S-isoprenylcysteine O-methyltransferase Ste14